MKSQIEIRPLEPKPSSYSSAQQRLLRASHMANANIACSFFTRRSYVLSA